MPAQRWCGPPAAGNIASMRPGSSVSDPAIGSHPSFWRSLVPMVIADDDRCYVAANPAACLLLRLPEEKVLRMRIDDLTPPENRAQVGPLWDAFLREGTQEGTFELLMPDGQRVSVDYSATAGVAPGQHLSILTFPPGHSH